MRPDRVYPRDGWNRSFRICFFFAAGFGVLPLTTWLRAEEGTARTASAEAGEKVFAVCAACHLSATTLNAGPHLRGVYGRAAGSVSGFRYSRALKNARRAWDDANLDAFLADPQAAVPGNAMPYPGLPDSTQRQDLIAYLKTLK